MSINENDDECIPTDSDAYYEAVASQEEIYLEESEEELRAILIFGDPPPTPEKGTPSMSHANDNPCIVASPDEQQNHAAEELITGDSDDPPLSEQEVVEMLRMTHIPKASAL